VSGTADDRFTVVFCGTPQFAVPTLQALAEAASFSLELVVTQPDRPVGRGMTLSAPPVKQRALELGLPIMQPDKIRNNQEFRSRLEQIAPRAIVVVGYGRIIPQWMIDLPPLGNINLHASLLPKYRGAAPIQWAIANGESLTGVTTMRIDAGLDTGDILLQREVPIGADDTALTLGPRLAEVGAPLLVETLLALDRGAALPVPQDHSKATLAPILKKEDGGIEFARTATEIWNRMRGFQPWPGAWTRFRGKTLNVTAARPLPQGSDLLEPGTLKVECDHLYVGCGESTTLELVEVQPEGKRRMPARDFVNGYRPKPAEKLGQ
jgi:methionyl-tRNA formyltransferase